MIEELENIERACIVISKMNHIDLKFKFWKKDWNLYGGFFLNNEPILICEADTRLGMGELSLSDDLLRHLITDLFVFSQSLTDGEKQERWWNKVDTGYETAI